ncbi:MAG: hypothetical protein RLZZ161_24, partial [Bacteroidota bacterium]|jgi:CDP-diacylglycerol pyrophosphatase
MKNIGERNTLNSAKLFFYSIVFVLFFVSWTLCHAVERSDILLDIVQTCVDQTPANYCRQCRAPRSDSICNATTTCQTSTEVWSESVDFVAIRDIKMCGCPTNFVHGLVLPKSVVTGIEDPNRPIGIWQFSWDVASQRIPENEIALAVNSKSKRTQNQLHVHLVRLKEGLNPELDSSWVGELQNLQLVWEFARQAALTKHMSEYGVLVARSPNGGFRVAITQESPEGQFTQAFCTVP